MSKYLTLFTLLLFSSCDTRNLFDGPDYYADDFESYSLVDDLIDGENVHWSFFQNTVSGNTIVIDTNIAHSGSNSIRCAAGPKTDGIVSKASINKQFMAFWEGEIVSIEAWYYIPSSTDIDWLFICDLEEATAIGAGPGMRLSFENGNLLVEHKYPMPDIIQAPGSETAFPFNQWVHIRFDAGLSQKDSGYVRVWQDGVLILSRDNWQTLPRDILYFQQGTKGMYSQIEFGVTANGATVSNTVYVDDVLVHVTGNL